MTLTVYACVHHDRSGIAGPAIMAATEGAMDGPWVLGGERPATHAFLVVDFGGLAWRFEGRAPSAAWDPWPAKGDLSTPTAMWRLKADETALRRVVMRARGLNHTAYGWDEIVNAAEKSAEAVLRRLAAKTLLGRLRLPPLPTIPKRTKWLVNAMVCSQIVAESIRAGGAPADVVMAQLPDVLPERLGQALRAAETTWCERTM